MLELLFLLSLLGIICIIFIFLKTKEIDKTDPENIQTLMDIKQYQIKHKG